MEDVTFPHSITLRTPSTAGTIFAIIISIGLFPLWLFLLVQPLGFKIAFYVSFALIVIGIPLFSHIFHVRRYHFAPAKRILTIRSRLLFLPIEQPREYPFHQLGELTIRNGGESSYDAFLWIGNKQHRIRSGGFFGARRCCTRIAHLLGKHRKRALRLGWWG